MANWPNRRCFPLPGLPTHIHLNPFEVLKAILVGAYQIHVPSADTNHATPFRESYLCGEVTLYVKNVETSVVCSSGLVCLHP